jgi:uncharacterized protein YjbI with pentapeptide repeats
VQFGRRRLYVLPNSRPRRATPHRPKIAVQANPILIYREDLSEIRLSSSITEVAVGNDALARLVRQGSRAWNNWRDTATLTGTDRSRLDLSGVDLSGAKLAGANLSGLDLSSTNLSYANLSRADLSRCSLHHASLAGADLSGSNLTKVDMRAVDLTGAILNETILADLDLTTAIGLEACAHLGPSIIDHRTLVRSLGVPLFFLRSAGVPDRLIDYIPAIFGKEIQFYSCFIAYSAKDQVFAERLHADLQNSGVRCWFAPHDLPIGAKTWDAIDEAIRLRDKMLVILSNASITSNWVETEINKAFAEERERKATVLFPVRIDDAVMSTAEPWAVKLRDQRQIGDFRHWRETTDYQRAISRLVRDLTVSASIEAEGR